MLCKGFHEALTVHVHDPITASLWGQCPVYVVLQGAGVTDGLFKQPPEHRYHRFSAARELVNWSDRCACSCPGL